MTNALTFKLMAPGSATPAARAVPGVRAPHTEGFGLVRRPLQQRPAADALRDRVTPPVPRGDGRDDEARAPMSQIQRDALHALIHARPAAPDARWARRDRGIDVVWAGTLALLLALAVVSLDSGKTFVATADHLHMVAAARASAVTATAKQQPVTRQSSAATSRTM